MKDSIWILIVMLIAVWFTGCSTQDNDNEVVLSTNDDQNTALLAPTCIYWPLASEAAKNEAIVNKAREEVGIVYDCSKDKAGYAGQCKWWVQEKLIPKASYNLAKRIPNNDTSHPIYWNAKWLDEGVSNVRVVWRATTPTGTCLGQFPTWLIKPGHVFQIRWRSGGPHTFVVSWISTDSMGVIDCNWDNGCNTGQPTTKVTSHTFKIQDWTKIAAWTAYQIL